MLAIQISEIHLVLDNQLGVLPWGQELMAVYVIGPRGEDTTIILINGIISNYPLNYYLCTLDRVFLNTPQGKFNIIKFKIFLQS